MLRAAIAAQTVVGIEAAVTAAIGQVLADGAAEAASDAVAAAADTADAVAAVASVRADATFLHRNTLHLKVKIAAVIAVQIVDQTEAAIAVDVAIRIAAATRIAARGVISIIAAPTLRVLPLPSILLKSLLCCPASRWRNIASVRCR